MSSSTCLKHIYVSLFVCLCVCIYVCWYCVSVPVSLSLFLHLLFYLCPWLRRLPLPCPLSHGRQWGYETTIQWSQDLGTPTFWVYMYWTRVLICVSRETMRVRDNNSMKPRFRNANLLSTHVLDSCINLRSRRTPHAFSRELNLLFFLQLYVLRKTNQTHLHAHTHTHTHTCLHI